MDGGSLTRGAKGGKTRSERTLGLGAPRIHKWPGRDPKSLHRTTSPNFLTALMYADRLGDDDLRIYPCSMCKGLRVGHHPERRTRERRRIMHELQSLEAVLNFG